MEESMTLKARFWTWFIETGDNLICWYWDLKDKIRIGLAKLYLKSKERTIKGDCALEYYKSIRDGKWQEKDRIADYEAAIEEAIEKIRKEGGECSREEVAGEMVQVLEWMKGER